MHAPVDEVRIDVDPNVPPIIAEVIEQRDGLAADARTDVEQRGVGTDSDHVPVERDDLATPLHERVPMPWAVPHLSDGRDEILTVPVSREQILGGKR